MDELAKEYVIDFFTKRLIHFKDSPESVGWTRRGQLLRYETVLKLMEPEDKSLLDFGCGKGDFYGFLKGKGIKCDYTGIDINPSLIELAKKKYPEAEFHVMDIENEPLDRVFDYTIAIGVFNLAVQDVKELMQRCLKILFQHTRERLILTCLNQKTKLKDICVTYFSKEELERIAKALTDNYQVIDNLIGDELFLILKV
ncbi:methyltransferase domain-containing protein [Thermodesulfovibrio aggregans]|uniref:Methyltransferase domain-containing protein n=1 Tax=Thermodesulfovibrio aggregans TaxID=86166 RepID=A0A0U9HM56_9BACT|nr:class I SAM-dependent methyltransferase [Thermodesulfovibrio aggregans]GAQ94206.1 methyltransferase domain-containing protein [Thermodesulfovibrio aggregans]